MSVKTVYFYKLSLFETKTNQEQPIGNLKSILETIIDDNVKNDSLSLSPITGEPMFMDVLERHAEYLFVRLSKKRRNNSIQKRNYATMDIKPVLSSVEAANSGIEMFTYCIIGYKHGIISIARTQGAPDEKFLNALFGKYSNNYFLRIDGVPNNQLINELYDNEDAEINRITLEIPTPNVEILSTLFRVDDTELLDSVQNRTETVVVEIKPQRRGCIVNDQERIRTIINALITSKDAFKKVFIDGKPNSGTRQRKYDLYEEYFKYEIEVKDTHIENGRIVEYSKQKVQDDYRLEMMNIYDHYKECILALSDRFC